MLLSVCHNFFSSSHKSFISIVDRIQNIVEVFDSTTQERLGAYDLVSKDGKSGREGPAGPCLKHSVLDDKDLQLNDPAPDLMMMTTDGKHLMIAFRGPVPVSVSHSAQGSCPGVGIVELTEGGKSGRLIDVLRTTNTIDTSPVGEIKVVGTTLAQRGVMFIMLLLLM